MVGAELVRVVSVATNVLGVLRARAGTVAKHHEAGTHVSTVPVQSLPRSAGYSVRWAGLIRPQYAETYTFTAKVPFPASRPYQRQLSMMSRISETLSW